MSEWQDISTAPKDRSHILLYVIDDVGPESLRNPPSMVTGFWYSPGNQWHLVMAWGYEAEDEVYGTPTHWMPLPPPPTT